MSSTKETIKSAEPMEVTSFERSETMQEIVSNRPGFIVRWGNFLFLLIIIFLCIACWFIKYPDIIKAPGLLASINEPKPVVSLIDGKLKRLLVTEGQMVKKDEVLGYVESVANYEDVLMVSSNLAAIQSSLYSGDTEEIKVRFKDSPLFLGELQTSHQTFSQAFLAFSNYLSDGVYQKRRALLVKEGDNLLELNKNLKEQMELQEQDLVILQKTFSANETLNKEKVLSDFDYRSEQSKLINKKITLPQIKSAIINNENQLIEKEKEMNDLQNLFNQQKVIFQQALNTFSSQVEEWKKRYTLRAPINGKVAFAIFMQEDQQLQSNQTICYVSPENSSYFAEILIPQSNFGKVHVGQQVLLKLQSYPFQEYGLLIGRIEFISKISSEKGYLAKVTFENGLTTSHKKQIQYRDGLLTDAEIVTRDMRLLERFYFNVFSNI